MSYSNYQLSQRINNLQYQINNTTAYINYDLSSLPFTLPTTTYKNIYVLFTGTVGSGGILIIPILGFTIGTFLSIKNGSGGTVNISTTSIPFTTTSTSTALYDLSQSETLSLYFNGSYWIQTSLSNKVYRLTVTNSINLSGSINVNTIIQSSSGQDISLYGTTTTNDILIGETLPAGKTLRLCNTTLGTSGGSVHCCNVGFDASHINNATAPATGLLKLGNSQNTGALYIGCGSASATRTTGPILIGADSTASGGINIGTDTDLAVPTDNTINIGSTGYATIVKGSLSVVNGLTVSGGNISLTTASGTITAPSGGNLIGPYKNAVSASASITTGGVITGASLVLGAGAITSCGAITSSGLITVNGGLTVASGQTLTVSGTLDSNKLDGIAVDSAQTIGGGITSGSITIGGELTTGSIKLGGVQTTGDINIGNTNATGDIYIGNGTNATTGANRGICSIQKLQVGNTTANSGNGLGTGTPFRCVIMAKNVGSTTSSTGTINITGAPTSGTNPLVFASINTANGSYFITIDVTGLGSFNYNKSYWNGSGMGTATAETFNYVAYWL